MSGDTEREALLVERIESAISLAFEGEGEAWSDKLSGDRLAAIAARAIEPILTAHDKRVRAEQGTWREAAVVVLEQVKINGRPALEVIDTAAAIREASDD